MRYVFINNTKVLESFKVLIRVSSSALAVPDPQCYWVLSFSFAIYKYKFLRSQYFWFSLQNRQSVRVRKIQTHRSDFRIITVISIRLYLDVLMGSWYILVATTREVINGLLCDARCPQTVQYGRGAANILHLITFLSFCLNYSRIRFSEFLGSFRCVLSRRMKTSKTKNITQMLLKAGFLCNFLNESWIYEIVRIIYTFCSRKIYYMLLVFILIYISHDTIVLIETRHIFPNNEDVV